MDLFSAVNGNPPDRDALAALTLAIEASQTQNLGEIEAALAPWGPGQAFVISWGPAYLQNYAVWVSGDVVVVLLHGVQLPQDLPALLLQSGQTANPVLPGATMTFTAALMAQGSQAIDTAIQNAAASTGTTEARVIFAGHSHGGSMAVAYFTAHQGPVPSVVSQPLLVTFGMPRVLNPTAARALTVPHVRIENPDDMVPRLPPADWINAFPVIAPFPGFGLFFLHHGEGVSLDPTGVMGYLPRDSPAADPGLAGLLIGGYQVLVDSSAHGLPAYRFRLQLGSNPPFGFPGGRTFGGGQSMPIYKVSYLFQQNLFGWSEIYWLQKANAQAAMTVAADPNLINLRKKLMGQFSVLATGLAGSWNPEIVGVRINNVELQRDALNKFFVNNFNQTSSLSPDQADIPNTCLQVRWKGADVNSLLYQRQNFMRGIPDSIIDRGGQYKPSNTFANNLTAWGEGLKERTFGFYLPNRAVQFVENASIAQAGPDVTVTTQAPHGGADGNVAYIGKVRPRGQVQGRFIIRNVSVNSFTIPNLVLTATITKPGHTRVLKPIFVPMTGFEPIRATHRITGRPFYLPRGRQRSLIKG